VAEQLAANVRESPLQAHLLVVGAGITSLIWPGARCSIGRRGGCIRSIGEENVFVSKLEALAKIVPRLDPERCRPCRLRIFHECAKMPGPPDFPATTAS
jgi:hypothetical protein